MRSILLIHFVLFSVIVSAQNYSGDLKKAINIHKAAMDYFNQMPGQATQSDIDNVLKKFTELNEALYMPYMMGTKVEQTLAVYYKTIYRFRLGYMYAGANDSLKALTYYEEADAYMDSLLRKNTFPINFRLGSDEYNIDGSYFRKILPIMYLDMASLFSGYLHWQDAEKYSRLVLSCDSLSNSNKLRATGILIASLEQKEHQEKEILMQVLSFWKTLRKADAAVQRKMRFTDEDLLQRVRELTDKVFTTETDGKLPAIVAEALFELNKNEDAEAFLKLAQKKPNTALSGLDNEFFYKAMMNGYKYNDKDVMKWASLYLGTSYILPRGYVKDVIMVLNYLGDREFARMVKKNNK